MYNQDSSSRNKQNHLFSEGDQYNAEKENEKQVGKGSARKEKRGKGTRKCDRKKGRTRNKKQNRQREMAHRPQKKKLGRKRI